jgi:hypothetical protein
MARPMDRRDFLGRAGAVGAGVVAGSMLPAGLVQALPRRFPSVLDLSAKESPIDRSLW